MDIPWPDGWQATDENAFAFEAELQRELGPRHPLFGASVKAVGYCCDDVLFLVCDGTQRVAEVHLTWRGLMEEEPPCPSTLLFGSMQDWIGSERDEFGTVPP